MGYNSISSPGVYGRIIDNSVRPADPPGIGAAVIGPRSRGPALVPVTLKSPEEDELVFGSPNVNGKEFSAYAAQSYLDLKTNPLTFVRTLGLSDTGVVPGWTESGATAGLYALCASGSNVVALIYASSTVAIGTLSASADAIGLTLLTGAAGAAMSITASVNKSAANYIGKMLNTDPTQYAAHRYFLYAVYDYGNKIPTSPAVGAYFVQQLLGSANFQDDFITGSTTTIISQPFNNVEYNLFGIGSINAGDSSNTLIKVSVQNIQKSVNESIYPYGTFTLVVRDFNDNDRNPVVLESFSNLTLDPESPNYVCRRIGDKYQVWDKTAKKFNEFGEYDRKSNYIYLIPSIDLKNMNVPETALPWGFSGYPSVGTGAISSKATFPDLSFVSNMLYKNDFNTKVYFGAQIINNGSGSFQYGMSDKLKHLPKAFTAVSGSTGLQFSLKWLSASVQLASGFLDSVRLTDNQIAAMTTSIQFSSSATSFPSTSGSGGYTGFLTVANIENTPLAKFTLPIVDGFDGVDVTKVNPFDPANMGSTTAYETYAYRTALDMLSNQDEYELTDLALPGVYKDKVADYALQMVENRGDMFYIMDFSGTTVADIINDVVSRNVDSAYAATFYPALTLKDKKMNKLVPVPASTIVPTVFAYSDSVAFSWFAPAGFSRGGLLRHGVTNAKEKLGQTERSRLYDNRINPIATFPKSGPVIWGQKTLQVKSSARDRINVSRMLLKIQKQLSELASGIVFEPSLGATWSKFVKPAEKILENVLKNYGIKEFKLIMDDTNNTPDYEERNIMLAQVAVVPTRSGEVVLLDLFVTNNRAEFT